MTNKLYVYNYRAEYKKFSQPDYKGNVVAVTNSTGQIIERTSYDPFGAVLSGGRQSRFGYEGKEQDTNDIIPLNGLVSYYSFNDGTNDEVTNNTGSVVNATKTTGIIRDSYFFNGNGTAGKTQGYISIPNSNVLNISGSEITLSVWIKPNLVQGNEQIIISKNSYLQYKIGYVSSGLFRFTLTNISSITKDLNTPLTYTNTSMWYHIVGTYNGSIMRLYVNGVEVTNTTFTGNIKGSTSNVVIGCFASSLDRCFNGSIDEIGIWNKAISSSEIKSLYNNARNYDANPSTDFNFRMLSTTTGQFQQPDNIIVDAHSPQTLNRYSFEDNSPYNNQDPTGHCPQCVYAFAIGFAISTVNYGYTHQGEGAGSFNNFVSYMGKGIAHGVVGGATAAGSTALVVSGGIIAAGASGAGTLGTITYAGQATLGALGYTLDQIIDGEEVDTMDLGISALFNALPYAKLKPGTYLSANNMLSPNNAKVLGNQAAGALVTNGALALKSKKAMMVNGLSYYNRGIDQKLISQVKESSEKGETAGELFRKIRGY